MNVCVCVRARACACVRACSYTQNSSASPNRSASPTCPQPRYPRRRVSVVLVARPQLPPAVGAPAVDAAARQQRARVLVSGDEGADNCRRKARRTYAYMYI